MENKMTIREFIEKYNKLQSDKTKENLIDSIIVRHYAPIAEKKAALDLILKKCIQEKDGIEYIDSFLMQVGLMSVVLSLYTNLDCDGNMFENYDLLMEDGIYPIIMYKIGERDIKELMNVYSSVEETFVNQQTFEAYLAKQVTRFGELFGRVSGAGLEAVAKILEDDEKMNMLTGKLTEVMEKGKKFGLVK
jgi:hypothetical protein